jgi:hypothetical protein
MKVFVSPHYYYPHDRRWIAPSTAIEDTIALMSRKDALSLESFEGSGADFPQRYKPYFRDLNAIVTSPHKVYGTSTNDMVLQLRRYRIEKTILAGPGRQSLRGSSHARFHRTRL